MRLSTLFVCCLFPFSAVAAAQDVPPPSPLARALAATRSAGHESREAAIMGVLALKPTVSDIVDAIDAGLPRPTSKTGWHVRAARDAVGTERPYHVYVPKAALEHDEESSGAPLLIDMHGGVSRKEFISEEDFKRFRGSWNELADEYGFVVAMPLGRGDCTWWSDAGVAHVRATIRDVKRLVAIDDDRLAGTGFSDGGTGSYYLAMVGPDPFAGLLPMNGHPVVASRASERQLYLENARATPLFVAMTQDDQLYPGKSVLPHVQALFDLNASVKLVSYPTGGHTPSYFEDQGPAFARFIVGTVREPLLDDFEWRTAESALGRFRWLEIDELGPAAGDAPAVESVNVMTRPGRVRLGFNIGPGTDGSGVNVAGIQDGSTAATIGLKVGDAIVALDGKPTLSIPALRAVLGAKGFGEPVSVEVRRGETGGTVTLTGEIAPFIPKASYIRDKPTARVAVRRNGQVIDVTSRNVRAFRVLVSPDMFDLSAEIDVRVNGTSIVKTKPTVDVAALVRRYATDADNGRLFPAEITVRVPAAE